MTVSITYDLAIIGSGPAGVSAAVQAAKLGRRVCIIERNIDNLGGAWIQTGTLPSKTLRELLAMTSSVRVQYGEQWLKHLQDGTTARRLMARAKDVSQRQNQHVRSYLAKNGVIIISGTASLRDPNTIEVTKRGGKTQTVQTTSVLLASGSRPRRPPDIPFDGWRVVDADEILQLATIPKSIVIYGAGVVGCEYACIFAAMGTQTVIADARPQIMTTIDQEIATELQDSMQIVGVEFCLNQKLTAVELSANKVKITLGETGHTSDVLFFAAGRIPNSSDLWHEGITIATDSRGYVLVDDTFRTSVANIYAAGDLIGAPALAATSAHQGRVAASNALGMSGLNFPQNYPVGVYTIPELSSVGYSEEQLQDLGIDYVVGRAHYSEIARGYIRGDSHGKLKLLICKNSHKIIGVHIVGDGACELIHIGMVFMHQECHAQDLLDIVYNYPTLAEGYKIAAFNGLNKLFADGIIAPPPVSEREP